MGFVLNEQRAAFNLVLKLQPAHLQSIRDHLLSLGADDRYLRFGMPATDDFIHRYVDGFDFTRDCFFGVTNSRLEMIGLAHLAYSDNPATPHTAEFGVSVTEGGRGFGVGTLLFKRSAIHARNTGITVLYVHCLSTNAAMMHIARKAGMTVEYAYGEADAFLTLPPGDPQSISLEVLQDQSAQFDYKMKEHLKRVLTSQARLFRFGFQSFRRQHQL